MINAERTKASMKKHIADFLVGYGWHYDPNAEHLTKRDDDEYIVCEIWFCEDEVRIERHNRREPYYEMKYGKYGDAYGLSKRKGCVSFWEPKCNWAEFQELRITKEGYALEPVTLSHDIHRTYKIFTEVPEDKMLPYLKKNEKNYKQDLFIEEHEWYGAEE